MTKTANHDEEKPVPPPTDRAIIKAFLEEADSHYQAGASGQDYFAGRAHGHAEARRELAEALENNRKAREAYVKEAADRITKAATEAGEKMAALVTSWYRKVEAKAEE